MLVDSSAASAVPGLTAMEQTNQLSAPILPAMSRTSSPHRDPVSPGKRKPPRRFKASIDANDEPDQRAGVVHPIVNQRFGRLVKARPCRGGSRRGIRETARYLRRRGVIPDVIWRRPTPHLKEAKLSLRYISLIVFLIAACTGSPARATIWFVSGTGSDSNVVCSYQTPCQTLGNAVSKANVNDTVACIGTVDHFTLTITKSIDIDCSGARAFAQGGFQGTFDASRAAITINIPASVDDPFQTVRLRGISISGNSTRDLAKGINIVAASAVFIDDVSITDVRQQGILDGRTGGQTHLYVANSIIRNCGGPGIVAAAATPGITVLDNVHSEHNSFGLAVAIGNNVTVSRSVLSGNSVAGVIGDGGSQIVVDDSTISHNGSGVISGSSVRLSNNNIAFNGTAISGSAGTFGNNRFSGNASTGTAPVPLGGASSDFAQQ